MANNNIINRFAALDEDWTPPAPPAPSVEEVAAEKRVIAAKKAAYEEIETAHALRAAQIAALPDVALQLDCVADSVINRIPYGSMVVLFREFFHDWPNWMAPSKRGVKDASHDAFLGKVFLYVARFLKNLDAILASPSGRMRYASSAFYIKKQRMHIPTENYLVSDADFVGVLETLMRKTVSFTRGADKQTQQKLKKLTDSADEHIQILWCAIDNMHDEVIAEQERRARFHSDAAKKREAATKSRDASAPKKNPARQGTGARAGKRRS